MKSLKYFFFSSFREMTETYWIILPISGRKGMKNELFCYSDKFNFKRDIDCEKNIRLSTKG